MSNMTIFLAAAIVIALLEIVHGFHTTTAGVDSVSQSRFKALPFLQYRSTIECPEG